MDEKLVGSFIVSAFADYGTPQCLLLIYCACFNMHKLAEVDDLRQYVGVAAFCAILLSLLTIINVYKDMKKD